MHCAMRGGTLRTAERAFSKMGVNSEMWLSLKTVLPLTSSHADDAPCTILGGGLVSCSPIGHVLQTRRFQAERVPVFTPKSRRNARNHVRTLWGYGKRKPAKKRLREVRGDDAINMKVSCHNLRRGKALLHALESNLIFVYNLIVEDTLSIMNEPIRGVK